MANKDAIYRETALPNGVIVDNEYRSTTYNHYLLVLQLESTIDTLNTLFGVNLQLETLFVVLKEMDTFETDVDMNYHLIFVEKLLATQGVKVDKKRVFTQLKKTDSLEAVFDGISTLKDSESPLDLLLPISFESTPNWKKYEKNKKYEHSKDTEKQIKL